MLFVNVIGVVIDQCDFYMNILGFTWQKSLIKYSYSISKLNVFSLLHYTFFLPIPVCYMYHVCNLLYTNTNLLLGKSFYHAYYICSSINKRMYAWSSIKTSKPTCLSFQLAHVALFSFSFFVHTNIINNFRQTRKPMGRETTFH